MAESPEVNRPTGGSTSRAPMVLLTPLPLSFMSALNRADAVRQSEETRGQVSYRLIGAGAGIR